MTPLQTELRALSRLAEEAFAGPALHSGQGPLPAVRMGDGNDFLEFAEYRAGDDVKTIDWRRTAKQITPAVRRNRARASTRWSILVDCSASMQFGNRWRVAKDLATAFAGLLLHQSHRVGLILFDSQVRAYVPERAGVLHLNEITEALVPPPPGSDGSVGSLFVALERLVRPTGVVILSDLLWGAETEAALRACGTLGGRTHVLRLVTPEDTTVPAGTRTIMDAETGKTRTLLGSDTDRNDAARRQLEALEARAAAASRKAGAVYSSAFADAGWNEAIIAHMQRAARLHA